MASSHPSTYVPTGEFVGASLTASVLFALRSHARAQRNPQAGLKLHGYAVAAAGVVVAATCAAKALLARSEDPDRRDLADQVDTRKMAVSFAVNAAGYAAARAVTGGRRTLGPARAAVYVACGYGIPALRALWVAVDDAKTPAQLR